MRISDCFKWWLGGESNPRPRGYEAQIPAKAGLPESGDAAFSATPSHRMAAYEALWRPLTGVDGTKRAQSARTAAVLALCVAASGCATCREHPVACVASVVVVGAIAAHEIDRHRGQAHPAPFRPACWPNCAVE